MIGGGGLGGRGRSRFVPQPHPSGFSTSSFVVLPTGRSYGRVGGVVVLNVWKNKNGTSSSVSGPALGRAESN